MEPYLDVFEYLKWNAERLRIPGHAIPDFLEHVARRNRWVHAVPGT